MIQVRSLLDTVNVRTDLKPARVLRAIRDGIRQAATDALLIRSTEALELTPGASVINFSDIAAVVGNEKKQLVAFTGLQVRPYSSHTDPFRDLGFPQSRADWLSFQKGAEGTPRQWTQNGETIHIYPAIPDGVADFCDVLVEYAWVPAFDDDFETVELGHSEISLIIPLIKAIIYGLSPVADNRQAVMSARAEAEYRRNISRLRSFARTGKQAIQSFQAVRYPGAP